ncbi:MAG: F-actin-capping protein subunit beta [Marteilia pararefringens]
MATNAHFRHNEFGHDRHDTPVERAAHDLTSRVKPTQLGRAMKCMRVLFRHNPNCSNEMLEDLVKELPIPVRVSEADNGERFFATAYNTVERSVRIPATNQYVPPLNVPRPEPTHLKKEKILNRHYRMYANMYTADQSQVDFGIFLPNDDPNSLVGCGILLVQPSEGNLVGRYQSANNFHVKIDQNTRKSGDLTLKTTVNIFLNISISDLNISCKYMGYVSQLQETTITGESEDDLCCPLMSNIEKNENNVVANLKNLYFTKIVSICTRMRNEYPIEEVMRDRAAQKNLMEMAMSH